MKNTPLSHVDAAWLSMEDPTNLMMVNGILLFKGIVDFNDFVEVVRHRWLKFDRFQQHVVYPRIRRPLAGPRWELDPHFDVNAHIHRVALPAPGDYPTLQNFISDLASTPLDYTKPLWQCHVIEGYEEGTVIMSRLHHAIADGIALMYVLLSMADITPEASLAHDDVAHDNVAEETQRKRRGSRWGLLGSVAKRTGTAVSTTRSITGKTSPRNLRKHHQSQSCRRSRRARHRPFACRRPTRLPHPRSQNDSQREFRRFQAGCLVSWIAVGGCQNHQKYLRGDG